jgi:glycosyltransferase involved in cell wall biosynthesis
MGPSTSAQLRNILWFNWRDIKNPEAGGAEVFTHEVASILVNKKGYNVTLFTARFPDCLDYENLDGVNIIRDGDRYSVYNKAKSYYKKYKHRYDAIIDEINTRPFLTPRFVKKRDNKPILALVHQLAREFWFFETHFPLSYIGYHYLEKKWLSYYKDIPTAAVSQSTKGDLESMGFTRLFIVPEGLKIRPLDKVPQKVSHPTVVFVGRLKKAKLPDHAVAAFSIIKRKIPDAQMWVIGDGYLRDTLLNYYVKDVTFYGHVKEELKYRLLSRAHLVLVPGVREGWGLVVTEANAMGTPAVAYDVHGLRDSVRDGQTGVLVKEKTPQSLARSAISLLQDRDTLDKLSFNALAFSKEFSWDNTEDEFDRIIQKHLLHRRRLVLSPYRLSLSKLYQKLVKS